MSLIRRLSVIINILLISSFSLAAREITITEGHVDPIPVAVNHFSSNSVNAQELMKKIKQVVTNDLKSSSFFKIVPEAAYIENKIGIKHRPLFASWRQINSQVLLNGDIELKGDKLEIKFIIWDTTLEKDIHSETFELSTKLWRRAAHKMADTIYERITGDKGYFNTRIAYISESGPAQKKIKKVAVMDFDGENNRFLTDGKNLVLTPRFSPKGDKILYLSYARNKPRVYVKDLRSGKESVIGDFPGMSFAPKFSPDGSKALMSVARNGATNIYEINFITRKIKKLTDNLAINTSPSYSPDGRRIVFNSNRSGSRQIYVMDSDGTNVERISFGTGMYTAPVWSPRGDYIAFTKQSGGFVIGVMKPDGSLERTIASGYLVEGPTWSPSGRQIMFAKESKGYGKGGNPSHIFYIDITGQNERKVPTPMNASDPDWSNLLD